MIPTGTVPIVRCRRRAVVLGLLGSGLTLTAAGFNRLVPGASARQEESTPGAAASEPFSDQVFAGAGFVGEAQHVPAGRAFVGVVVAEPEPGAETREARALIYGESANGIMEWFPGSVSGDRLDLVSENGARLTGEVTADGTAGEIILVDGTTVDFDLVPATGVAGLYTMSLLPGGQVEGTSERGATLTGQLIPGSEDSEHGRFAGTFTSPDGKVTKSFDYDSVHMPGNTTDTETLVSSGNGRLVVLEDGQFRGGAKPKGGQFSWPCID
jgi:hypothetical protein